MWHVTALQCCSAVDCRYLFALQVKRDLLTGALACQQHTAILLASYIVQGKLLCVFIEHIYVQNVFFSIMRKHQSVNDSCAYLSHIKTMSPIISS